MHWLMGDLQGCGDALARWVALSGFSPSRHRLTVLGDVVNRGPHSLATLRQLKAWEGSAQVILGNHDLHLLAVAQGVRAPHRSDTIQEVLDAPDRDALLDWLRQRPLAVVAEGWLCVHAGLWPQWTVQDTLEQAAALSAVLNGPQAPEFWSQMYGNTPAHWQNELSGPERWRAVVNALTRMRYLGPDGSMDFLSKEGTAEAAPGLLPWFDWPGRATAEVPVAFGHWSTLGLLNRPALLGLDTGCVWGGALSSVRVDGGRRELLQVACAGHLQPGGGSR